MIRKYAYYAWSALELVFGLKNPQILPKLFFKPVDGELKWLKLRRGGLKMAVRGRMEAWSVKEALIDRFYSRYSAPIQKDWTVVDIGAAVGEFTVEVALACPQGRVYALEPNPGSVNILRQNIRVNQLNNVEVLCLGLWEKSGEVALSLTNDEPLQAQSMEEEAAQQLDNRQSSIPVITLEELLREHLPGAVDLIKLDCEGAEYEIFYSTRAELFQNIFRIIMEYHDLDAETKNHEALQRYLEGVGYTVRMHRNPVHSYLGYLYAERSLPMAG